MSCRIRIVADNEVGRWRLTSALRVGIIEDVFTMSSKVKKERPQIKECEWADYTPKEALAKLKKFQEDGVLARCEYHGERIQHVKCAFCGRFSWGHWQRERTKCSRWMSNCDVYSSLAKRGKKRYPDGPTGPPTFTASLRKFEDVVVIKYGNDGVKGKPEHFGKPVKRRPQRVPSKG